MIKAHNTVVNIEVYLRILSFPFSEIVYNINNSLGICKLIVKIEVYKCFNRCSTL